METTHMVAPTEVEGNGRVEKLKEVVRERVETAKVKAREGYEKASEKAHEVWEKAADTSLNDVNESVNAYVRKNPGKSLLMAAGAGLVVGLLIRRRRD